jgi:predicted ester cyclase
MKRRRFIAGCSALAAGTLVSGCENVKDLTLREILGFPQSTETMSQIERNKAIALRWKKAQTEKDGEATISRMLAPGYRRARAGMEHLAKNAEGQGHPSPGPYLRNAFPDRVDVIEEVIAEGNFVGLLFRVTGTHRGNLFGIAPTGRTVNIYEVAILRLAGDWITDGWFMADEAGLLKQLGAKLPPRKDGKPVVPLATGGGEDPDVVRERIESGPLVSREDRNRLIVAQSKSSNPPKGYRAPDYRQLRQGFQHLRDYGNANKVGHERPTLALPDRRDRIDGFIAEGDTVWMQFRISGTHKANLYGHPPTGRRVEVPEIGIARFEDGKWKSGWYFGDELGLMLQLGALHMLG